MKFKYFSSYILMTIFLFFFQMLAVDLKAQELVINLKDNTTSLGQLINEIEKQTNYLVVYSSSEINTSLKLKPGKKSDKVSNLLKEALANTGISYEYENNYIILSKKKEGLVASNKSAESNVSSITVSGIVVDSKDEPLIGVTVSLRDNPSFGTVTDIDGKFTLANVSPNETLRFAYIGMTPQDIKINNNTKIDVTLREASELLEEVVVVGYGVQKKSVVTGSISSVNMKNTENQQIGRIEQVMQGRTTGLTIASSSGAPGAAATVRVRGATSLNDGANEPLYVVDGVVVGSGAIDGISPNDIQSIEILKDAASAAIYGARSSSGVILVTTKSGSLNDGIKVSYNGYIGTQAPAKKLDLLNASQYATIMNEQYDNSGMTPLFDDPNSYGKGTDWQEQVFNNNALVQSHEVSFSGGNKRSTFFSSFSYFDQEGIVTTDISKYQRYNIRLNSNHQIKDWVKIGQTLGYSRIKNLGGVSGNDNFGGPLSSAVMIDPITSIYETNADKLSKPPFSNQDVVRGANGEYYAISDYVSQQVYNPLAYVHTRLGNHGWSENIVGNAFIELGPFKGVKFRSTLGARLNNYGNETFTPKYFLNSSQVSSETAFQRTITKVFNWNLENTLTYQNKIGKHDFTILLGQGAYADGNSKTLDITYYNLPVNSFDDATMNYKLGSDNINAVGSEGILHTVSSLFSRVTYDYDNKYLFTGIIRRDGSSRFGANNRYGTFPSASIGWVPSMEGFWKENKYIDFLKLRLSYGITGNDAIGNFRYVSTISDGRNYIFGDDHLLLGYSPDAPANPDLKWEETSQLNFGIDATFLRNFRMSFDLFEKKTTGILQTIVIPNYLGATGRPSGNVADMKNSGVELELNYANKVKDFDFSVSGNISYLNNEVTYLGEGKQFIEGEATLQNSSYPLTRTALGQAIGSFYGFETLGVFQNQEEIDAYVNADGDKIQPYAVPGDFKWADLSKDGKIDEADRTFIGDPTPNWTYGLTFNASWRNFDFLVFGQGVMGNEIFQGIRRLDIPAANWQTSVLDRWHGEGTSNSYPRLALSDDNKNFSNPSTFHLEKGDYFRIKTLQLGYTLPKSILGNTGISRLRLYVSANNLLTFTGYSGFDPEIGGSSYGIDRTVYPQARSFIFGVNFDF